AWRLGRHSVKRPRGRAGIVARDDLTIALDHRVAVALLERGPPRANAGPYPVEVDVPACERELLLVDLELLLQLHAGPLHRHVCVANVEQDERRHPLRKTQSEVDADRSSPGGAHVREAVETEPVGPRRR